MDVAAVNQCLGIKPSFTMQRVADSGVGWGMVDVVFSFVLEGFSRLPWFASNRGFEFLVLNLSTLLPRFDLH